MKEEDSINSRQQEPASSPGLKSQCYKPLALSTHVLLGISLSAPLGVYSR